MRPYRIAEIGLGAFLGLEVWFMITQSFFVFLSLSLTIIVASLGLIGSVIIDHSRYEREHSETPAPPPYPGEDKKP